MGKLYITELSGFDGKTFRIDSAKTHVVEFGAVAKDSPALHSHNIRLLADAPCYVTVGEAMIPLTAGSSESFTVDDGAVVSVVGQEGSMSGVGQLSDLLRVLADPKRTADVLAKLTVAEQEREALQKEADANAAAAKDLAAREKKLEDALAKLASDSEILHRDQETSARDKNVLLAAQSTFDKDRSAWLADMTAREQDFAKLQQEHDLKLAAAHDELHTLAAAQDEREADLQAREARVSQMEKDYTGRMARLKEIAA